MNLNMFIICLLTVPIDLYLFMDLTKTEFEKRENYRWLVIPVLAFATVSSSFITAVTNEILNFFLNVLIMFMILVILFKKEIVKKIIYVELITFIIVLSELILAFTYSIYAGGSVQKLSDNIYSWAMIMFGVEIIKLILVKTWERIFGRNKQEAGRSIFLLLLLFPIVSLVLTYALISLSPNMSLLEYREVYILIILLFLADVFLFVYVERMMIMMKQQKEYELDKQKNEMESQYYKRMEEINREQAMYHHDMKHYLETIAALAEERNVEELRKISGQLSIELNKVERIRYTGNEILNVVLWEKKNQAAELDIQMNMQIEPGVDTSFIKDTDLIAMTGNLIDNAIEAVRKCSEDKNIEISLFESEGNFIIFQVMNCFTDKPIMKNGVLATNKKNAKKHGMGVESVRKLAEKYGGILDVDIDGNHFKATLGIAMNYIK
ncbi:MAG: GHKL domain-containing protein [Lachnospiraceae bacterium]|nr:GHKL domain-containing protein [Lachnospiraceae bacterium]